MPLSKGDIIINPKTQRPVRIGSRTWLKLVKEGIVEGAYKDTNELYKIEEGDDEEEKIKELNKELPPTQQAVRGRGKYAGKIVRRKKQPSIKETAKYTAKVASKKIKNKEVYEDLHQKVEDGEEEDFETQLEKLIMAEIANLEDGGNYGVVEEESESEESESD